MVPLLVAVRDHLGVHHIGYCPSQALINAVEVGTELFEFRGECLVVVCHVQEGPSRRIDEAVLLPDGEDIFLQAHVFEPIERNRSDFDALGSFEVVVHLRILIKQSPDLLHLLIVIATVLVTEKLIESLQLTELNYAVVFQVRGHEDLIDILQLLSLQLVGGVDHKLCKVVQLNCLLV